MIQIPSRIGMALTLALVALGPGAGAQEAPAFDLEAVLSAPFASGLVATPAGDRIAWVRNHRGVRNIWVADAPEWVARRVTDYTEDTGQELENIQFTRDGDRLLWGVGGAPNRSGDFPNPRSLPLGPEVALYLLDLETGERVSLPGGASRTLSPDGTRYAFTRGGAIHIAPIPTGPELETPESEVLLEPRGGGGQLTWSPDGERLAFVSSRGDHAFVGIYDLSAKEITWMAPSLDRDLAPAWSPDGRRIAFVRAPNERGTLPFFADPDGPPWSIRVGDPATGEASEVFRAREGAGSVFRAVSGLTLEWSGDGRRLIFPWEESGWTHLYSLDPDVPGAAPVALSPGAGEVQWATLSTDRDGVIFSSNHEARPGDRERRHLWRAPVTGAEAPRLLTPGDGIEWEPVALRDDGVAYLASGPTTPAHAEVLADGRERVPAAGADPAPMPTGFPADRLVTPRKVTFPAADGMRVPGQLFEPPARCGDGPHPGLLFFHGGSRRQMLLGFHNRGYYHNAYAFNQYMANRCFVVLSVNYRSGVGYGLEFREAEAYGAGGASEVNDVIGAGRWLAARREVDAERVALWGGSYGGYLTAWGLARAPELFAAGVDFHGAHDWRVVIANFTGWEPEEDPELARLALESSPIHDLSRWTDPVLLVHGDDDRNVPFSESVDLAEDLRRQGVPVESLVLPDEVHGFLLWRSWVRAYEASAEFLVRQLGPAR